MEESAKQKNLYAVPAKDWLHLFEYLFFGYMVLVLWTTIGDTLFLVDTWKAPIVAIVLDLILRSGIAIALAYAFVKLGRARENQWVGVLILFGGFIFIQIFVRLTMWFMPFLIFS